MENQENNNTINNRTRNRKQCYRNLLSEIEDIQESNSTGLDTIQKTKNILNTINLLNKQSGEICPDETLLDTQVLSTVSNVLVKCTKAVDVFLATYEPLEFAKSVADSIKTNEEVEQLDFLKLLPDARDIIPNVIEYNFIYGACDFTKPPEPKVKTQRLRAAKEAQEKVAKKELIEVKKTQNAEEENNDNLSFLLKVLEKEFQLNNAQPLRYYDFVIDSKSYSETVENMFYCSFLIRDGKAAIEIDKNNVPFIKLMSKKDLKSFRHNNGSNTQMIASLDMGEWNRLKSKEGYIQKHRRSKR